MQMRPEKELRLESVLEITQSDLIYLDLEGTIISLAQIEIHLPNVYVSP